MGVFFGRSLFTTTCRSIAPSRFGLTSCAFHASISIANCSVLPPGMLGGLPCLPYAYSGANVNTADSPSRIEAAANSKPRTTAPLPSSNSNGSRPTLESNCVPSATRVPV